MDDKLAFLDCHVHLNPDGSLNSTVCCKPTHTDHFLQFDSNHPLIHKLGVIIGHFTTGLTPLSATPRTSRKRKTISTNRWEIADIRTGLSPKLIKPGNNLNHHNPTRMIILLSKLFK